MAETVGGAEGSPGFFDSVLGAVGTVAGVYGSIELAKQRARSDQATLSTATVVAQAEAERTDYRWKWIALAGVGLVLSLVMLKKTKVA